MLTLMEIACTRKLNTNKCDYSDPFLFKYSLKKMGKTFACRAWELLKLLAPRGVKKGTLFPHQKGLGKVSA